MKTRKFTTVHASLISAFCFAGCSTATVPIRRLSPLAETSSAPGQCRLVTVVSGLPAEKAGLREGDVIEKINGVIPQDAAAVTDLISKSPDTVTLQFLPGTTGASKTVSMTLNKSKPRLGAMCDLSGWRKSGVTAAGNESVTIYSGAYAATFSGIIDKGLVFLRVRAANNSSRESAIGPADFKAKDSTGADLRILTPHEVICYLYGDKGAHLLALKRQKVRSLDKDTAPAADAEPEVACDPGTGKGTAAGMDLQYAEANAEYIATESLWAGPVKPGLSADGLIYLRETSSLPITLSTIWEGHRFSAQLGSPQAQTTVMAEGDLVHFFEKQTRGTAMRLTLKKGKVFVGKFASWDGENERVWFDTPASGLFNTTSYPLVAIRAAEVLEQIPAKAVPTQDHSD